VGFLDSIFTSDKKDNRNEKRLVDCVEKNNYNHSDNDKDKALFTDIMNDLGSYIEKLDVNNEPLLTMAYAYTRRCAAAGLCAQGMWGQEELDYTQNMFLSFQQTTGQTIEFQENAAEQAYELIIDYDSRFNKEILKSMLVVMMKGNASRAMDSGRIYTTDDLLILFKG